MDCDVMVEISLLLYGFGRPFHRSQNQMDLIQNQDMWSMLRNPSGALGGGGGALATKQSEILADMAPKLINHSTATVIGFEIYVAGQFVP